MNRLSPAAAPQGMVIMPIYTIHSVDLFRGAYLKNTSEKTFNLLSYCVNLNSLFVTLRVRSLQTVDEKLCESRV